MHYKPDACWCTGVKPIAGGGDPAPPGGGGVSPAVVVATVVVVLLLLAGVLVAFVMRDKIKASERI